MITENLTTLKINKLTKAQYEAALAAGTVNENELYMTPEGELESDIFIAEFNVTPYEDVDNAYKAGKLCFVKYTMIEPSPSYQYLSLVDVVTSNVVGEPNEYYFSAYSYKWGWFYLVCLDSDGYWNDSLEILPDVTEEDAGKVLTVNEYGNWVAAVITKPTTTTTTMLASNWNSENKTYDFESTYPNASYDVEIDFNYDSGTTEQYEAYGAARLGGSVSTNKIKAMGDVPSIDIPIVLMVTEK